MDSFAQRVFATEIALLLGVIILVYFHLAAAMLAPFESHIAILALVDMIPVAFGLLILAIGTLWMFSIICHFTLATYPIREGQRPQLLYYRLLGL